MTDRPRVTSPQRMISLNKTVTVVFRRGDSPSSVNRVRVRVRTLIQTKIFVGRSNTAIAASTRDSRSLFCFSKLSRRDSQEHRLPVHAALQLQWHNLGHFGICKELPRPVVERSNGQGGLERVGEGPGGAIPLPGVEDRHPELCWIRSVYRNLRGQHNNLRQPREHCWHGQKCQWLASRYKSRRGQQTLTARSWAEQPIPRTQAAVETAQQTSTRERPCIPSQKWQDEVTSEVGVATPVGDLRVSE